MAEKLKRVNQIREALSYDLGSCEMDLLDEIVEILLGIIKEQSREMSKLQDNEW